MAGSVLGLIAQATAEFEHWLLKIAELLLNLEKKRMSSGKHLLNEAKDFAKESIQGYLYANNADLIAELKALRESNELLRAEVRAVASHANRAAKTIDKWDNDGFPAERIAAWSI